MSAEIKRDFKGSDAEMLTAIDTIIKAASDNQTTLVAKRSSWADPFFTNLQIEIDSTTKKYLGVDNAKDLRKATQLLAGIQADALSNLEDVKVQVERDFREDATTRDELLKELGYTDYFKAASRNNDQGALVNLLFRFQKSLTPDMQTQLTTKGIDAGLLTTIMSYAGDLNDANVSQEAFKSTRKGSTQSDIIALNAIYNKVMDVAIIAANIFKKDKATQSRFSYSQALNAQRGGVKIKAKQVDKAQTPVAK